MNSITKKPLSRRTLLKGAGAAIGLPFLESMIPALTPLARSADQRARAVHEMPPASGNTGFKIGGCRMLKPVGLQVTCISLAVEPTPMRVFGPRVEVRPSKSA